MKKFLILLAAIVMLSSALGCQAQTQYVFAPKSKVNLRATPSGAQVGTLQKNTPVPLIEDTNGWYKIDNAGKQAYASSSVCSLCNASIPSEFFGKSMVTTEDPADKLFYEGSMSIHLKKEGKVAVTIEWNSMEMHAVTFVYVGNIKDGVITLTHRKFGYFDGSEPLEEMLENAEPVEKPMYVGYNPAKNTVIFDGGAFGLER